MSSQILQYIISFFNNEMTLKAAAQFGEDNTSIQKAIRAIIPLIMKGFASKAAEGGDKADQLFAMADEATSSSWWQQVANWFTHNDMLQKGEEILNDLYGHRNVDRIASQVAGEANIKQASALGLMQWVAPLCIGALGKYSSDNELNASGLAAFLGKEKVHFETTFPHAADAAAEPQPVAGPSSNSKGRLWMPAVLLLVLAAIVWYYLKGCNHETDNIAPVTIADTVVKTADTGMHTTDTASLPLATLNDDSTVSYNLGDMMTLNLPGPSELHVQHQSAEVQLVNEIREALTNGLDTSAKGKSEGWINLYEVQFVKGITYRKGAEQEINNIAAILKAYPSVKIKIGGYTDNTGPDAVNVRLSQERADKVNTDLGKAGVSTQLEKAEGYGPQFPIADNTTAEGRAQNRRVSCRIVSVTP
ncbi:DUF937 domain-containing protein [Chitinophagaceae bacterium MMS25-I14]